LKAPHLLRVEGFPATFAPLIETARTLGLRIGWLELDGKAHPVPPILELAAGLGVLRAVEVGAGRSVAVKPMRGAPVLKDLLREHFRGCALVLVRGEIDAPSLRGEDSGWIVTPPEGASRRFSAEELAATLRKPRPWGVHAVSPEGAAFE
jgi:hypothetical protein